MEDSPKFSAPKNEDAMQEHPQPKKKNPQKGGHKTYD